MNIFYLNHDTLQCAKEHNDKHCVKMILEYCQLLSTAHRVLDGQLYTEKSAANRNLKRYKLLDDRESLLYKATHINHPSAIWCRQSDENYAWLWNLLYDLQAEYTYRYGKIHKCMSDGLIDMLSRIPDNIPQGNFTEPTPAMPDSYKVPGNSLQSYHNYYREGKDHLANWKNRDKPEWLT